MFGINCLSDRIPWPYIAQDFFLFRTNECPPLAENTGLSSKIPRFTPGGFDSFLRSRRNSASLISPFLVHSSAFSSHPPHPLFFSPLFLPLNTSLIPCGKFGSPYTGTATAASREQRYPFIPVSVCSISACRNHGMVATAWDL